MSLEEKGLLIISVEAGGGHHGLLQADGEGEEGGDHGDMSRIS